MNENNIDLKHKPIATERCSLNPKFTFENFIVGNSNRLARSAAYSIANNPTQQRTLYIHAGNGLGKTHLLNAIHNYIQVNFSNMAIRNCTLEMYLADLHADQNKGADNIREKYSRADLLLFDDFQFICGKEGTQQEFLHLFDTLCLANKPIVIAADRSPKDIKHLHRQLYARIKEGLIVEITPPDSSENTAIIKFKSQKLGLYLPEDIICYLAGLEVGQIRGIEGILTQLDAFHRMAGKNMPVESARENLRRYLMQITSGREGLMAQEVNRLQLSSKILLSDVSLGTEATRRR